MKARILILMISIITVTVAYTQDIKISQEHNKEIVATKKKESKRRKKDSDKVRKSGLHKTYTDMTFDELVIAKDKKIAQKDYATALKYLEQLLKICTDIDKIALLMIEYADLLFDQGELSKASKIYTEFTNLYPGHEKHEYALYKATICSYYTTLSSDRDQTATETAISLAQNFLDNKAYKVYVKEVTDIQQQCYKKIVKSELDICNFYLRQGNYNAAQQRVAQLKIDYIPKVPDIEADIIAMELEITEKQEVTRVAQQKAITSKSKHASSRF